MSIDKVIIASIELANSICACMDGVRKTNRGLTQSMAYALHPLCDPG